MYQPGKAWYPHVALLLGLMCTDTFVPSGTIGVASKLKQLFITASTDNAGFWQHGWRMFSVMLDCGTKLHQYEIRKLS
eukprot:10333804-Ditylum_brightwellii.AAC.1